MLDVYQVEGIVKQAQAEFRQQFEKDYPDIVEMLTEKIIMAAKRGETETTITFFVEPKNIEDIEKYLIFKGFYVKDSSYEITRKISKNSTETSLPYIRLLWPKG
jgi:hypothetical protein